VQRAKLANVMSVVGPSGSGKTTLICGLLGWFGAQGLKVAVLKHSHKTIDPEGGKDTGKFSRAGAQAVALAAPGLLRISRFFPQEPPLQAALDALAGEADLVLVEGYKTSSLPKIALVGPTLEEVLPDRSRVVALVSSQPVHSELPVFHPEEIAALGRFIKEYLGLP
jgi:molybdopterin-guanine dinucleotide biosynthesis adapter protein